jgi:hypothetical protein
VELVGVVRPVRALVRRVLALVRLARELPVRELPVLGLRRVVPCLVVVRGVCAPEVVVAIAAYSRLGRVKKYIEHVFVHGTLPPVTSPGVKSS